MNESADQGHRRVNTVSAHSITFRRRSGTMHKMAVAFAFAIALLAGLAPAAAAQAPPLPPLPAGPPIQTQVQQQVCAGFATVQPAAVRDQLLAQAGCPPVAADNFWGIHQNGWQVCVVNATNLRLNWVSGVFTDNVAASSDVVANSEECSIRGTAQNS
jgi:hypothetical protein